MCFKVDGGIEQVATFAQAGQSDRVCPVSARTQCFGKCLKIPASVPTARDQNKGRHRGSEAKLLPMLQGANLWPSSLKARNLVLRAPGNLRPLSASAADRR